MRETKDIDNYFRTFEMTAKIQKNPRLEWQGCIFFYNPLPKGGGGIKGSQG